MDISEKRLPVDLVRSAGGRKTFVPRTRPGSDGLEGVEELDGFEVRLSKWYAPGT